MTVGILALQGDVREHASAFVDLGADVRPVRRPDDLSGLSGMVLPGGESTTLSLLLGSSGLHDPLAAAIAAGLPVFGTCAGMILLATDVLDGRPDQRRFGAIDLQVRRNGYGRQAASFETALPVDGLGPEPLPAVFIRAPVVEVAGPGFINLTFTPEFLSAALLEASTSDRLAVRLADVPETAVVDYSAPNVAKEMHVGHLRTTVIGDSLVRLLEFVGHRVIRENHIGDWGTPFGMLIEHLLDLGEAEAADELSMGDLDGFYRQARAKFDADEGFKERSRQRVVMLQGGDAETLRLWQELVDASAAYFNAVYRKLGVLLTNADLAGESSYHPLLDEVIVRLDRAGLLQQSDGADVVYPPGFVNRDGEPLPLIVRKGNGGFNYATSDITCVVDRVERLGATLLLYVVGTPQSQHLQMVFATCQMLGVLAPPARAVHVNFGSVLGDDRKMLKSRSGDPLKFIDRKSVV